MLKKLVLLIIILSLCALLIFSVYKNISYSMEKTEELKTSNFSYILANTNGESQFSYSLQLTNTKEKTIFIKSIEPVINESVKDKILSQETFIIVDKNLRSNETLEVVGEIIVDTKGIVIQDVTSLITDIKVVSEEILNLK